METKDHLLKIRKKAQLEAIVAFGLAGTGLTLGAIPAAKFLES